MVGAVEQIERDIAALDQKVVAIATEFHTIYSRYLSALGQAVKQQLVLACYHLCTQNYPEAFLRLSFSQRQQLQQDLRQLAKQTEAKLLAELGESPPSLAAPEINPEESNLDSATDTASQNNIQTNITDTADLNRVIQLLKSAEESSTIAVPPDSDNFQAALSEIAALSFSVEPEVESRPESALTKPERLTRWQDNLEDAIAEQLQTVSHQANRLLQSCEILTKQLPEPILEAAVKSEAAETIAGPPHLLNLLVEAVGPGSGKGSSEGKSNALHVVAINLRLSEIEFSDATVLKERHQIRSLVGKLNALTRDYQKKQQERAIAEAEAAWRACWFDE